MTYSKKQERHAAEIARKTVLDILGRYCKRCGEADEVVLEVDHVHGTGFLDSKRNQRYYWRKVLCDVMENGDVNFQVLCGNCNRKKARDEDKQKQEKLKAELEAEKKLIAEVKQEQEKNKHKSLLDNAGSTVESKKPLTKGLFDLL